MAESHNAVVLIVSHNTCDLVQRCLQALHDSGAPDDAIAIADNASTDGTVEMIRKHYPALRLIENRSNLMYSEATNQLIEATQSRYIILLNPDTQPDYTALCRLLSHFSDSPELAAVAPQLRGPRGDIQRSCRRFPTSATPWLEVWSALTGRPSHWKMTTFEHDSKEFVLQPMFSAIVISRNAWTAIGGLNTDYPLFFNDVEWCERAYKSGWQILFDPAVFVVHTHGGTTLKYPWRKLWHSHISFARFLWRTRTNLAFALWGIAGVWLAFGVRGIVLLFK